MDVACRLSPDADYAEEYGEELVLPDDDNYTDYGADDMPEPKDTEG